MLISPRTVLDGISAGSANKAFLSEGSLNHTV
jgi:hypothetical protein